MPSSTGTSSKKLRQNKLIFAGIIILVIILFIATLSYLKSVYQTTTYYVLNKDVSAKTEITTKMLKPIVTQAGTQPKSALGISDVQSGDLYAQYPLSKGDILTKSNVGGYEDISTGVPDSWVVTNFSVDADSAVGGRITRGTYFDILVNTDDGSFYPFVNVLCLDTTVDLNSASSSNAANTSEAHNGQTTQYVVGMSPQDTARLQNLVKKYGSDIKLVLSPRQNEYKKPTLASYTGLFTYDSDEPSDYSVTPKNEGKNTDDTFSPLKRDKFGRPVGKKKNCGSGNAQISVNKTTGKCPAGSKTKN